MRVARFMDYCTRDNEPSPIDQWYEAQEADVKVAFDYALREILGTVDVTDSEIFKPLTRQHAGLWEIVLEVYREGRKVHFRTVGFWAHNEEDFILVDGCQKSGRSTVPPGVFDSVLRIREAFLREGIGAIHEHSL